MSDISNNSINISTGNDNLIRTDENGTDTSTARLAIGIDVGSTTVKLAVIDRDTYKVLHRVYRRHNARQSETVYELLKEAKELFPKESFRMAVCGSGGRPAADALNVHFVQEVVANAAAVQALYPDARTAVELGGQDAKLIFFRYDESRHQLMTSDMRMNGSCAGGTGAFLDEMAALFHIKPEEFNALASKGSHVYEISGRCGVFAKTDIQPLLIQGAERADVALSVFHAVAKQTIGGLSQGLDLTPPIIFEGGPLTFNDRLVKVFAERLGLKDKDIIIPEHPETIVALGTAIAVDELYPGEADELTIGEALERIDAAKVTDDSAESLTAPLFASKEELDAFTLRHDSELGRIVDICADAEAADTETTVKDIVDSASGAVCSVEASDTGKAAENRGADCENEKQSASGFRTVNVYIGIDSGSTTSKGVIVNEDNDIIDTFYYNNDGEPLKAVKRGLVDIVDRYEKKGIKLHVLGVGTTGYGEMMLAGALRADYHCVETVAHAAGCLRYVPDATFILDIGGQDMKAIRIKDGVVTDIALNEACSSGCGSFLENFANSLGIPVKSIADAAFRSEHPAKLGSRCTVFMNSTIINEQRNGRQADDIMAGLCRSIIENVFTKVIRISNVSELGDRVVVQGGTFRNRAVLRALEEYLGHEVILAPFPGEMGALGAALSCRHQIETKGYADGAASSFIGFDAVRNFEYTIESGVPCTHCTNHCSRTILHFGTGDSFVTGNRCERGAAAEDDPAAQQKASERAAAAAAVPDVMKLRERLLFKNYEYKQVSPDKNITIGIPKTLEFWDSAPFWSTFFKSLGYKLKFSGNSRQSQYESGLQYVASDTVCFPAKLVHGHIRELAEAKVDRIFMPFIMHMPPEFKKERSIHVCPVIMGYPMVVRNFQDPEHNAGIKFDTPQFHWFSEKDRAKQIAAFAVNTLGVSRREANKAFEQGREALKAFRSEIKLAGLEAIKYAEEHKEFAVVLAGRPYHTDSFVNHKLSSMFTKRGIPVLTVDAMPKLYDAELNLSRAEITNDFHARMLGGAMAAMKDSRMEYVQIVSFGCGHDAILSDEISRLMTKGAGKAPLILKMDESEASGSLGIRVQSFIETVRLRREKQAAEREALAAAMEAAADAAEPCSETETAASLQTETFAAASDDKSCVKAAADNSASKQVQAAAASVINGLKNAAAGVVGLSDPYEVKYRPEDKKRRTLLIPNISAPAMTILAGLLRKEGIVAKQLPVGGDREVKIGKRYTHNDICFPCQMVVGELIGELQRGNYNQDEVAVGMAKLNCDCRLANYSDILRQALDKAGFTRVPILSTDPGDTKHMHPGVSMLTAGTAVEAALMFTMLDILEELLRKIRPYELHKGEAETVFNSCIKDIADASVSGLSKAVDAYKVAIERMGKIPYDRSTLKPRVLVTGELLVNFHPGTNYHIEEYLENHGCETVLPRMTNQFRKDFIAAMSEIRDFGVRMIPYSFALEKAFDTIEKKLAKIASEHPLYEEATAPAGLYEEVKSIIPKTLTCGEGWLMAGEIAHLAKEKVNSFVILQPFGCLPNHVCGRGITKKLKEMFPDISILPLDLDPDTSYANMENRLQMLIMNRNRFETAEGCHEPQHA